MALISDQSNLFNTTQLLTWKGQYSGSQGTQDFSDIFTTIAYNPTVQLGTLNSTVLVTTGFNTYYKLQGYNSATGEYEVGYSVGRPNLIPPSSNLLSNIEIVLTWIDR